MKRETKFQIIENYDEIKYCKIFDFTLENIEECRQRNGEDNYSTTEFAWEIFNDAFSNIKKRQYTGIKDKNGVKIYEGDIVKIPDDYDTYGFMAGEIREIYFKNGGFRFKPKEETRQRGHYLQDNEEFEVIGNIYENPDLLNNI